MIKNYDILVNFSKDKATVPNMVFVKDDNLSTQLNFTFEDVNDQNVKLIFKNPTGTVYEELLPITNYKATYVIPNTFLSVSGYANMSLTYINGESVYTISNFINNVRIENNLGTGTPPTLEEISIINDIISQLNAEIEKTKNATANIDVATENATAQGTYAKNQGDYAKGIGDQLLVDKANGLFKGDKGDTGLQGIQGATGEGFHIQKTFISIAEMQANGATGLQIGDIVLISNDNTEDIDNSKMYVWNGTQFNYIGDLSGARGIQGQQGIQGVKGDTGTIIYEQLTDYATYQARKTAGTLVENVIYYWGE